MFDIKFYLLTTIQPCLLSEVYDTKGTINWLYWKSHRNYNTEPIYAQLLFVADLSFNNIEVIEGLDKLAKLKDLTLYNNRISKIENMDSLDQLHVFSIGNNSLKQLDNVSGSWNNNNYYYS